MSIKSGFTLIEMMLVVALIGILAAVAIPSFSHFVDKSKYSEAQENLRAISDHALSYYHAEHYYSVSGMNKSDGYYPGCQADDNTAPSQCTSAIANSCLGLTISLGERINPTDVNWNTQPWLRLGFVVGSPMLYCYEYSTNESVTTFTAKAKGSLSAVNDSIFTVSGNENGTIGAIYEEK